MTILIRPYTPADRAFILALAPRFSEFELPAWRTHAEIDSATLRYLQKTLDQQPPESFIFVAEAEQTGPAGFIHLQIQTDYFTNETNGYISDLAVAPAFEGQGIARRLLQTAEDWAREHGFSRLSLYVFEGNTRARQLYAQCGFDPEITRYVKPLSSQTPD